MKNPITVEQVRAALEYDEQTGEFTWKSGRLAGRQAGSRDQYVRIWLHGALRHAHRLAWMYVHGEIPSEIDHINQNKQDNRIANLRQVTRSENVQNYALRRTNRSGYPGVSWSARKRKWVAAITSSGRHLYIGEFHNAEDAARAYAKAAARLHTTNPFAAKALEDQQ